MAPKLIAGPNNWYIGTDAERVAMTITGMPAGYRFFCTDTGNMFILDGTPAWQSYPMTSALTAAIKTETDQIGTIVNTGGVATLGALLGDFANLDMVTRLGYLTNSTYGLSALQTILANLEDAANDEVVLCLALNTTTTTKAGTIVLFAINAIAGTIKDVKVRFYLASDGAATFTPNWHVTRAGDPTTFTARLIPAIATIATPAANAVYEYDFGDLAEGNQLEFRVAQDNNGAATVPIDGVLTYEK